MNKLSYFMQSMAIGVCPVDLSYCTAHALLTEPAMLDIEFMYTPERLAATHKSNGDPDDEPGEQEDLVITSIRAKHALVFNDPDEGVGVTLAAGRNMVNHMTDGVLDLLELELLKEVRKAPDLARLDAYLANRE